MKYYEVKLETQNPSADDYWNFKTKINADEYAERLRESAPDNKDYWGEATVEVFERDFYLMDE